MRGAVDDVDACESHELAGPELGDDEAAVLLRLGVVLRLSLWGVTNALESDVGKLCVGSMPNATDHSEIPGSCELK